MRTPRDRSAELSAKQAKLPALVELFKQLAPRAETQAQLNDDHTAEIIAISEAQTGRPFTYSKGQQKLMDQLLQIDPDEALKGLSRVIAKMDDLALLSSMLANEYELLEMEEMMAKSSPPPYHTGAQKMVDFRKETIRMIESFIASSPFKGQVKVKSVKTLPFVRRGNLEGF